MIASLNQSLTFQISSIEHEKIKNEVTKIQVLFQKCTFKCDERSKILNIAIARRKSLWDMSQQVI